MIQPRPYQQQAFDALDRHLRDKKTNPCVVIPTGGGKSYQMAWTLQQWKKAYPPLKAMILAHRKELVQQNHDELQALWPEVDIGIYAASLNRRDISSDIIYSSIDSVYKKYEVFPNFDVIFVDEAHRIPARGEGKYRTFISGCQGLNPNIRIIGFTATPYRMGCGSICHQDHILHEVCYEANIGALIDDEYLCPLKSRIAEGLQPDLDGVRKNSGGDYIVKSLAEAVDTPEHVASAIADAMEKIRSANRKSMIFFCVDKHHCEQVSNELAKHGLEAPIVTDDTSKVEREQIVEDMKAGRLKAVCNVNIFTEGFNVRQIDCVVLLRPTLSKGMYVQMVGRGSRLHPDKDFCLVLDYANCISQHGPVDCIDEGNVRVISCGGCGYAFSRAVRACPTCGWEIPKEIVERDAAEARERAIHEAKSAQEEILSKTPFELKVDDVKVYAHKKIGRPDSIRVEYRCGLQIVREWVCLDHGGYAEKQAREWWAVRFGNEEARTITVNKALDLFLGDVLKRMTPSIIVRQKGGGSKKHYDIIKHNLVKLG